MLLNHLVAVDVNNKAARHTYHIIIQGWGGTEGGRGCKKVERSLTTNDDANNCVRTAAAVFRWMDGGCGRGQATNLDF